MQQVRFWVAMPEDTDIWQVEVKTLMDLLHL